MEEADKDEVRKNIDEAWKEAVDKEKASIESGHTHDEPIEVTFNLFISGLMMEAMIALGEAENPITKKKELQPAHARFIIDTLAMLQDKTKNNLSKDETDMIEAVLYELRMRFVSKTPRKDKGIL